MPGAMAWRMNPGMDPEALDDPAIAAPAWVRFRRMFKAWSWFTFAVVTLILAWFVVTRGFESVHFYLAMAAGVGLTMLLGGALMGLMFLSSAAGHDEAVRDYSPEDGDSVG